MFFIIAFESTHQALSAEKAVITAKIPHETIPTPRSISANCGLSLKVPEQHLSSVQAIMRGLNMKPNIYYSPQGRAGAYVPLETKEG